MCTLSLQKILQRHVDSHFATDEEKAKRRPGKGGRRAADGAGNPYDARTKKQQGTARKSGGGGGSGAQAPPPWWHCARSEEFGLLYGMCPRKSAGALLQRLASSESSRRLRRAGVRLRRRDGLFSARNFDFFDVGAMAGVRHGVDRLEAQSRPSAESPPLLAPQGDAVEARVHRVLARRVDEAGRAMALVRWTPEDV